MVSRAVSATNAVSRQRCASAAVPTSTVLSQASSMNPETKIVTHFARVYYHAQPALPTPGRTGPVRAPMSIFFGLAGLRGGAKACPILLVPVRELQKYKFFFTKFLLNKQKIPLAPPETRSVSEKNKKRPYKTATLCLYKSTIGD